MSFINQHCIINEDPDHIYSNCDLCGTLRCEEFNFFGNTTRYLLKDRNYWITESNNINCCEIVIKGIIE